MLREAVCSVQVASPADTRAATRAFVAQPYRASGSGTANRGSPKVPLQFVVSCNAIATSSQRHHSSPCGARLIMFLLQHNLRMHDFVLHMVSGLHMPYA